MNWEAFYLSCFLVGLAFSVLSIFTGRIHVRLPHVHVHFGGSQVHVPHGGSPARGFGLINFGTIAAFLAWFGGTGYLLAHYSVWFLIVLGIAIASGCGGAAIVFLFLARVLIRKDEVLDPADYDMVGVLGTVSSSIRPSGTGEMIFLQKGIRRAAPARGEDGAIIPSGTEVVVTRYEHGIAYVRPWDELTKSSASVKEVV
jgi:membrane protein implicated in regulation of membrane protease activity